jgi:hypothetical protein
VVQVVLSSKERAVSARQPPQRPPGDLQLTAAKPGISERSGRRIDRDPTLPSQRKKGRAYRTRANPFEGISEAEIVPPVRSMPSLQAITILRELQRR